MGSWCSRLVYCEIKAFLSIHCDEWYTGIGGGGCCTENTWIWFDTLCFSQAEIDGIKKKAEEQTKVKNIRKLQNSASSDDKHQNHLHHDHNHHQKQHHEHLMMIADSWSRLTRDQWMFLQQALSIHLCREFSRISDSLLEEKEVENNFKLSEK